MFILMLVVTATGLARTIYADSANTCGIEDGSPEHPFNTVAEACHLAGDRDTIQIAPGTYDGTDLILRASVTMIGTSASSTLLRYAVVLASSLDTIPVTLAHLSVDNISRSDSGLTSAPLTVRDCIARTLVDTTVVVDSMAPLLIRNVDVLESVRIENALCKAGRTIEDSRIEGDMVLSSRSATGGDCIRRSRIGRACLISARSHRDTLSVSHNTIIDSLGIEAVAIGGINVDHNGVGRGIRTSTVSGGECQVRANTVATGSIVVGTVSQMTDIDSNVILNGGIAVEGVTPHATVTNNHVISDGVVSGIRGVVTAGIRVNGNLVEVPYVAPTGKPFAADTLAVCGVVVVGRSLDTISDNVIRGGCYGIYVKSVSIKTISRNDIAAAHYGLYLVSTACRIDSNRVSGCKGDGVVIGWREGDFASDSSHISLYANRITDNLGSGIYLQDYAFLWEDDSSDRMGGFNRLQGNGRYCLVVETPDSLAAVIPAKMNYWTHTTESDISEFDIRDGMDDQSRAIVAFMPFAVMGVDDEPTPHPLFEVLVVPNPVAEHGSIIYRLSRGGHVHLLLCDAMGREVTRLDDGPREAGEHVVPIDGSIDLTGGMPAGAYWCELRVGGRRTARRLIVR